MQSIIEIANLSSVYVNKSLNMEENMELLVLQRI